MINIRICIYLFQSLLLPVEVHLLALLHAPLDPAVERTVVVLDIVAAAVELVVVAAKVVVAVVVAAVECALVLMYHHLLQKKLHTPTYNVGMPSP